jgi:hypothetical protein
MSKSRHNTLPLFSGIGGSALHLIGRENATNNELHPKRQCHPRMMSSRSLFFLAVTTVLQSQAAGQVSDPLLPGNSQPDVVGSAVADTAALIGVSLEIELLRTEEKPGAKSSQQSWRILSLHQRIYERVMMASLQVDATTASIDNEIARSTEVRGFLADKRDRDVTRANLFSALLGGGLGATSAGLQLSSKQTNGTAATGIAGGAIAAGLSLYGIHAQRGGARILQNRTCWLSSSIDPNCQLATIQP